MSKQNKLFLFFLLFGFVLFYGNSSFALEVPIYPRIPLAPIINQDSKLPDFIVYFFALGIYLAGALAIVSLAIGGIQLVFSSVNPEARNNAIEKIKSAALGLVLLFASVIIIQTINPTLTNVQNTVALKPIGGLQLKGNNTSTPAPKFAPSLDEIRKNYSAIWWPATLDIINPLTNKKETISNCDPDNPNAVYVIYWYKEKGYKNFNGDTRLRCGQTASYLGSMNSYEIIKEEPGVYFYYDAPNCRPAIGSDSLSIPKHSTTSIPEWSDTRKVKSIRVVNGPNPKKGPFFNAIVFNSQDYKTDKLLPGVAYISNKNAPKEDNYSKCFRPDEVFNKNSEFFPLFSVVIYQAAGFKDINNFPDINCSVTLYSKSSWSGGYYEINSRNDGPTGNWLKKLSTVKVTYPPGTKIPQEEQKNCDRFYPNKSCLQSFEIKGNCLVIVASNESTGAHAQAFPISPRLIQAYINRPDGYSIERGTPQLEKDYITSGYS
ncbi:MAG: hypothetical protein HYS02_02110, partial [Candidatus Staskawiczbacteria bacterium]|nr:hypothetical protein [Candidatus Staskawiczbacteria bacterium]